MEMTLNSKKSEKIEVKNKTELKIEELEKYIHKELDKINNHEDNDTEKITSKIMYKLLMFYVESYRLNDEIIRKEALRYFRVNKEEYLNKIP